MHIKNRLLSLIFRIILVAGCGTGLCIYLGVFRHPHKFYMLAYYTVLSNLLCFLAFLYLIIKNAIELRKYGIYGSTNISSHIQGALMMGIIVTFLIYHFLLSPFVFNMENSTPPISFHNFLAHYFTPIMVILDYLFFTKKQNYRWYDPLLWTLLPYTYFALSFLRVNLGLLVPNKTNKYLYFFMDLDVLTWAEVFKYVSVLTIFFIILGYLIVLFDKLCVSKKKKSINTKYLQQKNHKFNY